MRGGESVKAALIDDDITAVLAGCAYRDWTFHVGRLHLTGRPVV